MSNPESGSKHALTAWAVAAALAAILVIYHLFGKGNAARDTQPPIDTNGLQVVYSSISRTGGVPIVVGIIRDVSTSNEYMVVVKGGKDFYMSPIGKGPLKEEDDDENEN